MAVAENVRLVAAGWPSPINPVPIPVITCGEVEEVSVIVTVPVRSPGNWGVKLTVTLHADPSSSDPMQFWEALMGSVVVPSPLIDSICIVEPEWFTIVTVWVSD